MNLKRLSRSLACVAVAALPAAALATPVLAPGGFPAPGGTNYSGGGSDIAAGGSTWSYSGFDPSAYSNLYYAIGDYPSDWSPAGPSLSMDGKYEVLSYNAGLSNLAAGVAVWTGATTLPTYNVGQVAVSTEFVLHVTDTSNNPLALTSASSLGLDPSLGAVLQVQGAFNANWSFLARSGNGGYVDAQDFYNNSGYQTNPNIEMQDSVGGAFYYDAAAAVPEPASATLLLGGALAVGAVVRRRSRAQR